MYPAVIEQAEPSAAQRAQPVFRHPRYSEIVTLMARRTPQWIEAWLREQYPLTGPDGERLPHARAHEKLRLSARQIDKYRRRFLPELAPGVDVLPAGLEDMIGRRAPPPARLDVERLDALQDVGMHNLERAMRDDELRQEDAQAARDALGDIKAIAAALAAEEVSPLEAAVLVDKLRALSQPPGAVGPATLRAYRAVVDAAARSVDAKMKLGLPGYEPATQRLDINQTTRSLNVDVSITGRLDPRTGETVANEPDKLKLMREVLDRGPDAARLMLDAARGDGEPEVVEGTVSG